MRSTEVPELDTEAILAACRERVLAVCPEHVGLAAAVLERVQPPRWKLEWYLPWWLGQAFGLDTGIAGDIVVSNVLGLASIRLQDDLIDGDVRPDGEPAAEKLSAALYDDAVRPYRARFDASSPFWGYLEACMSDWRAATHANAPRRDNSAPEDGDLASRGLPQRGAPLKISAFAVCLLTKRAEAFPILDRCLDHALTALVLYDHFCDWEADLEAGRWNAYVAPLTTHPQVLAYRDRNRSIVLAAMLTRNAIQDHFAVIRDEIAGASTLAETLGVGALAAHFRDWAARASEQGASEESYYRNLADRARDLLLGATVRPNIGR